MAEHRVAKHRFVIRLSRTTALTRVSALGCVVALALAGAPTAATAQTTAESLASTRAAIDATANQWFAAQRRVAGLDVKIATLANTLAPTEHQVERLRHVADARAIALYESNTQGLTVMGTNIMGTDPLEVGRRAALIGQANADDHVVIDELEAAITDLRAQRDELRAARSAQTLVLRDLARRRRSLDAQLASLQLRSAHAADRTQLAATIRHSDAATGNSAVPPSPAAISPVSAPTGAPQTIAVLAPATPPPTGAVSAVHDEPFLVCTRARESNGNYAAVSSGGSYYGAYQFLPTTWNATAAHAGRLDLVGVLPSTAAQYDQDEMAWVLYRWQGNSPWGGRC